MSNPQLTYWEECITCAADNGNISLTYSEVTQLAEGVMGGHENYGMAYVKWNPECRTTSVAKSVGCCKSVAFDRLCRLEDDGIITRYKDNNVSYWSVA